MCGIVGFVGERDCISLLMDGLKRLEYRGYDSAGLAVLSGREGDALEVARTQGKLMVLEDHLRKSPLSGCIGIGHTRWATHGRPSENNAHPHVAGGVAVVHNGIIENYLDLRERLICEGHSFSSETDTEIFAHLIRIGLDGGLDLEAAVRQALRQVDGAYALAVVSQAEPDKIVCAKNASPLVIGFGNGENYLASDVPAILGLTRDMLFLEEGEVAVIRRGTVEVSTLDGIRVERPVKRINWSPMQAEKGGYKHYMLKEIVEQPRAVSDTFRGRLSPSSGQVVLDNVDLHPEDMAAMRRIIVVACGTSYYAGLIGRLLLEEATGVPVEVDLTSEFRYRNPVVGPNDLIIGVSQSGETADTLAALKEAKARGGRILSICNVVDSSIPRISDHVLYTHAGPEIGVASTKAFTCQIAAFHLLYLYLGRLAGRLDQDQARRHMDAMLELPAYMKGVLDGLQGTIRELAYKVYHYKNFLYLGRGYNYPIAMEGALKLKEISYIHAEGYAAGEMKHGPIALIDEGMPVVIVAPRGSQYDKILSNLEEVKARGGRLWAVGTEGDAQIERLADQVILLPDVLPSLQPLLTVLPLQLLAYHVADLKGTDVDQPRNLAKSVTVE